jgi:uncharacterized membrane protein YfcA
MSFDPWWLSYPLLGVFAGFIAGLFGVGGGLTLVPILFMLYTAQGFPPEHTMHLALGTSMGTIVFTSISSMRAHHAHGAVRWEIVRGLAPGLVVGTLAGTTLASLIPTRPLAVVFVCIVYYASAQMMLDFKPKPHRQMPGSRHGCSSPAASSACSPAWSRPAAVSCRSPSWCSATWRSTRPWAPRQRWAFPSPWPAPSAIWSPAGARPACRPGRSAMSICRASSAWRHDHAGRAAGREGRPTGLPVKKLKRAFGGFLALLGTKMLHELLG